MTDLANVTPDSEMFDHTNEVQAQSKMVPFPHYLFEMEHPPSINSYFIDPNDPRGCLKNVFITLRENLENRCISFILNGIDYNFNASMSDYNISIPSHFEPILVHLNGLCERIKAQMKVEG